MTLFPDRYLRGPRRIRGYRPVAALAATAALLAGTASLAPGASAATAVTAGARASVGPLNFATDRNDQAFLEFYRLAGNGTALHVYHNVGTANQQWNEVDIQSDGYFEIQNNYPENLCIDIPSNNPANGVQVQGWRCLGDQQQFWTEVDAPDGFHFMIQNFGTGTCLNDWNGSTADRAPVKTYSCSPQITNDLWEF